MAKHNPMGVRQPPSGALPASGALSARHSWFTMWIPFVGGALLMVRAARCLTVRVCVPRGTRSAVAAARSPCCVHIAVWVHTRMPL